MQSGQSTPRLSGASAEYAAIAMGTRSDARLEYDRRGLGMRDVAGNALTALGSCVAASEVESAVEDWSQSVRVGTWETEASSAKLPLGHLLFLVAKAVFAVRGSRTE